MKKNQKENEAGLQMIGCLGLLAVIGVVFWLICLCGQSEDRPDVSPRENPWVNYDPSRPVTDIKSLDYDRMMIIYRDEDAQKPLRKFQWPSDGDMYDDPTNCYEDYYEELYEYYHD